MAALKHGLGRSLLELLIDTYEAESASVYASGAAPSVCMLVRNYRSHAQLLELPSRLFYR